MSLTTVLAVWAGIGPLGRHRFRPRPHATKGGPGETRAGVSGTSELPRNRLHDDAEVHRQADFGGERFYRGIDPDRVGIKVGTSEAGLVPRPS